MKKIFILKLFSLVNFAMVFISCNVGQVEYKPPILPVKLIVTTNGDVLIEGEANLVTPIGEFSIGAQYYLKKDDEALTIILRDTKKPPNGFDKVYRIKSSKSEFVALVNGKTIIEVHQREILLDITHGSIESIQFKEVEEIVIDEPPGFWKPMAFGYKSFALTTWMYNDSTIEKWYGLGFLLYVLRLFLSFFALIIDIVIIIILGFGILLHSILGETVRNIFFGLLTIIIIWAIGFWISDNY